MGLPAAIKGIRRWEPLWPCLAWVVRRRPSLRPADWPPKLAHPRSSLLGQMCCCGRAELVQTSLFWHPAVRCHDDVGASEGGMARLAVTLTRIPRSTLAKIKCGRTRPYTSASGDQPGAAPALGRPSSSSRYPPQEYTLVDLASFTSTLHPLRRPLVSPRMRRPPRFTLIAPCDSDALRRGAANPPAPGRAAEAYIGRARCTPILHARHSLLFALESIMVTSANLPSQGLCA